MNGSAKLKNKKVIALDTNIFIYQFHDYGSLTLRAGKIFSSITENELKTITSIITLTELLSFKAPVSKIKELKEAFLQIPNLNVFEVDEGIALEAAKIRRKYGFRLPDSIQLATAKINRAKVFISNDQRLKKFKGVKVILLTEV